MYPTLYTFHWAHASFSLRAYPFFLLLAGLTILIGGAFVAKRNQLPLWKVFSLLVGMTVAAFMGARLLHGLLNFTYYHDHPNRWLALDLQGFAIFGGILFSGLIGYIGSKLLSIHTWKLADDLTPFLGMSIAMIRVGCFLNGCCFGKETGLPWGVTFPFFSQVHKYQLSIGEANVFSISPVHPTQLYELIAALVGSMIAIVCIKKKMPSGSAAILFGIWFSLFRLADHYLRVPAQTYDANAFFYPLFYATLIVAGILLLRWRLRIKRYNDLHES